MKKTYNKPALQVVELVHQEQILAGSGKDPASSNYGMSESLHGDSYDEVDEGW